MNKNEWKTAEKNSFHQLSGGQAPGSWWKYNSPGKMDGWMDVKAILRIAYSNQKEATFFVMWLRRMLNIATYDLLGM